MALPKIDLPIFEAKLPSTGRTIQYRPFTVKEEKIMLIAQEDEDPSQEMVATKQVVNNCLIDMDITELAMFDLEYVFLLLRSRSVDNTITFGIVDPDTDEPVELTMDIEEIKLLTPEGHTNEIKINDDFMLYLKYPSIDEFIKIAESDLEDPLINYMILISCLDKIASEDEVHEFKDYTSDEVDQFMENIQGGVIRGIQNFFETMPKLRHEMKYTNKEGNEKTFVIEGMKSFFV
jgi:hypothetical protein